MAMHPPSPEHEFMEDQPKHKINWLMVFGVLVFLNVVGFGIYYIVKYSKNSLSSSPSTAINLSAQDIRNIFRQTPSSNAPVVTPSEPSLYSANGGLINPSSSSGTTMSMNIRTQPGEFPVSTQTPSEVLGTTTPVAMPGNFIYTDPNQNFKITLPSGWELQLPSPNSYTVKFYNTANPKQWGYIEYYTNLNNINLNDVYNTLAKSSSVANLQYVTAYGMRVIKFTEIYNGQTGFALISGNKLYYIRRNLNDPGIVINFQPM